MDYLVWIMTGYLSGSIPTGYLLGKLKGIDLTQVGSGSTGTTNVLRSVGKVEALLTLIFDVLKGFFPVYFAIKFQSNTFLVVLVAAFCIIGHSKSLFLKFKGGKSSATGLGILTALSWEVAVITFALWIITVMISKYSSLGSIVAIPLVPLWMYFLNKPFLYILTTVFAAVYIVLIRHRENIKRLIKGTEPKINK